MKIAHRTVGSLWIPQFTFTVGGTNTDPTNLTVRLQDAAGVETVPLNNVLVSTLNSSSTPIAKTATGVFKANPGFSLTAAGYWYAKAEGTGAVVAAIQDQVIVDPDEFTLNALLSERALVGLGETRDWLQQQNLDVTSDLELVRTINDVCDRFHYEAGREFKPFAANPQTRIFPADQQAISEGVVTIGDLTSLGTTPAVRIMADDWTTVVSTVQNSSVTLSPLVREPWEPVRQLVLNKSITKPREGYRVEVTGTWGFPAVPGNVRQAVLDAVASTMDREVEHYRQDLGVQTQEGGNVILVGTGRQRPLTLPPSALAVAWGYRRTWLA